MTETTCLTVQLSEKQTKAILWLSGYLERNPEDLLRDAADVLLHYHKPKEKFFGRRHLNTKAFPRKALVEIVMPKKDWIKIILWGRDANISFNLARRKVIIINKDLLPIT